jgi:ABC-type uncharacterized transport system fused permease/ATPase subunit
MFSSQRTTNILLLILLVVISVFVVRFEVRTNEAQRSLNYIGENTWQTAGSVEYIQDWGLPNY